MRTARDKKEETRTDRRGSSVATRSRPQSRRGKPSGGVVRIGAGLYRRTPIPVRDREGLRPTPDRVRETVFDWLGSLRGGVTGQRVLDLFAGTGALGLEAASRGAREAVFFERDRAGAASLRELAQRLGAPARVVCGDAFALAAQEKEPFDLIFIDPPFASRLQLRAAQAVLPILAACGILYLESDEEIASEELEKLGMRPLRRLHAGAVFALLAERIPAGA